ncbi:MAG: hypothetical protein A2V83_02430 [Nitrospirae bacterium RBG_16_64_22]|nr:MAG: hypothetical protein A2V83_02430 [Nitrospirae bacterium RBG_16_64_22]
MIHGRTFRMLVSVVLVGFVGMAGLGCSRSSPVETTAEEDPFARRVVSAVLGCAAVNVETDLQEIVGPPGYTVNRRVPAVSPSTDPKSNPDYYTGFVSLGYGGEIIIEMGTELRDGPGADLRIYQAVADEPIEVFVAASPGGPWKSLGIKYCPESCDFDLSASGLASARYVRIVDKDYDYNCTRLGDNCQCYYTAGADIDAVEALNGYDS